MARPSRTDQIARELTILSEELGRLNRTTITEAHALLEVIFELHGIAIRRLAEAEA